MWPILFVVVSLAVLCAFLLLPGSIAAKTHLALHGICAQRTSHSLYLGAEALPLDARMTGIYNGAAVTGIWLLATGNARSTRMPPRRVIAVLALFAIVMAADGLNALALDLGLPHPYDPSNGLRLVTGVLAGTALGVLLIHLLATTVWVGADRARSAIPRPSALGMPLCVAMAIGSLAHSGLPILYAPIAVGLLILAVGVFAALSTIALVLVTNRGWTYSSFRELAAPACAALVVAVGLIAGLAGARLLLETSFGLPKLT